MERKIQADQKAAEPSPSASRSYRFELACENRPGLYAATPLLTPLAVEANRPIPLLMPLAGHPKLSPEAMAESEEERGSVVSHCNGWIHSAMPVAAAAEPGPRIQFLRPQYRMVHKDACIVFYDLF